MIRWAGLALVAMMPLHVALRPEHGWLLLNPAEETIAHGRSCVTLPWWRAKFGSGRGTAATGWWTWMAPPSCSHPSSRPC